MTRQTIKRFPCGKYKSDKQFPFTKFNVRQRKMHVKQVTHIKSRLMSYLSNLVFQSGHNTKYEGSFCLQTQLQTTSPFESQEHRVTLHTLNRQITSKADSKRTQEGTGQVPNRNFVNALKIDCFIRTVC